MPTYEYQCKKCGKVFELFQSITAPARKTLKTDCAKCNNRAPVTRLIGAGGGVIFKGSGFYGTDYRSESYQKAAKAEKDAQTGGGNNGKDSASKKTADKSSSSDGKQGGKSTTAKTGGSKNAS